MKHIRLFETQNEYRKHLSDGGGLNELPKVSYVVDNKSCKYNKKAAKKAYFIPLETDIDQDGVKTLEPFVYDTTGIKSVKINGVPMIDFVPKTVTKVTQSFEDILNATSFKNDPFYETTDDNGNTIYLMNDPKSTSFYVDPDAKFVFGDDFNIDEYYVMLFAKMGIIPIVSENYPLSQIVGTQSDLIFENNTFELSDNFKTQLKEYQALGVNPVAIPYKITAPYESNYVLETVKVEGTTQITATEDMFITTELTIPFVSGNTTLENIPIAEVEFEFDDPSISSFMFATELEGLYGSGCGCVLGVNKDFYSGLNKIPSQSKYKSGLCFLGCEIVDSKLSLNLGKNYIIPESVTEIGNFGLAYNILLNKLVIPSSVKSIGDYGLGGCINLKSLEILESVIHVGNFALQNCSGLTSITCKSRVAPSGFIELSSGGYASENGVLYHPKGSNYTNWLWGLKEGWRSVAIEDGADTTDDQRYLYFEPVENGLTISMINQKKELYYKVDKGEWQTLTIGATTPSFNVGQKIYFKAERAYNTDGIGTFVFNKKVKANGPVESLMGQDNYLAYPLSFLFKDCTNLVQAPKFAALELCSSAYYGMFENCTSLVEAPELQASSLAPYCYYAMFKGCTSLTKAPKLSATMMSDFCYAFMFDGCTSLVEAPELPSKNLAISCYNEMFMNCTSLVKAPELPAALMQDSCYFGMFVGCSSLTTAPVLNAKRLARLCYGFMFQNCTALTNVQEILPSTALVDSCYQAMFLNCNSLTKAPELPAFNLAENCYAFMFQSCDNLSYIKAMFTTEPSATYTYAWVQGVNTNGTFVKNANATWDEVSINAIPSGWDVETVG